MTFSRVKMTLTGPGCLEPRLARHRRPLPLRLAGPRGRARGGARAQRRGPLRPALRGGLQRLLPLPGHDEPRRPRQGGALFEEVGLFFALLSKVLSTFEPDIDPEVVARLWRLTVPEGAPGLDFNGFCSWFCPNGRALGPTTSTPLGGLSESQMLSSLLEKSGTPPGTACHRDGIKSY